MSRPPNESGGLLAAAVNAPSQPKPDCSSEPVKIEQVSRWLDDAIAMCRNAASDPCEHQRLGIWLARIRRALP